MHITCGERHKNTKALGTAVAHLGFGIMAIGILASGLNFGYLVIPLYLKACLEDGDEENTSSSSKTSPYW